MNVSDLLTPFELSFPLDTRVPAIQQLLEDVFTSNTLT